MGPTVTKTDEIEQIIGIILAQQYILNAGLKRLGGGGGKGNMQCHQR